MKKLFIAINLPKPTKEKIFQNFCQKLKNAGVKTVKQQNLHITLKFLGYLNETQTQEVKEKLKNIDFKEFEVKVFGVGEFNGRVIWVKASDENDRMENINKKLNDALQMGDKRFHPHITIARNKNLKKAEVKKLVFGLNKISFEESFLVKSMDLMESQVAGPTIKYLKIFQKDAT